MNGEIVRGISPVRLMVLFTKRYFPTVAAMELRRPTAALLSPYLMPSAN